MKRTLACATVLIIPLAACSDVKQSWNDMWGKKPAAAAPAPPAPPTALTVAIHKIDAKGIGMEIGTVHLEDTPEGLKITTALSGLPAGKHGFHVHQNPDCGPAEDKGKATAGLSAGGHFDPQGTSTHTGPAGEGHLGDLPVLTVAKDGTAKETLIAPRLKAADVVGRSIMIHASGDNYSDTPKPLGGGGARIACGVAK